MGIAGGDVPELMWPEFLSGDILGTCFSEDAGAIREHLEACPDCRERIERAARYLRIYREELRSPSVHRHAREIIGAAAGRKSNVLRFAPYSRESSAAFALAAQTSIVESEPLRFCSDDEQVLLKQMEATPDSPHRTRFILQADSPELIRNATLIFSGTAYAADSDGVVDFGDAANLIDERSQFILTPRLD